jgi:hypothetical protein
MSHMSTTYTVCKPPKFAQFIEWNCARCGHLHLGSPVFVTSGAAVLAVGSGCAAKLVYGESAQTYHTTKVKNAAAEAAYQAKVEQAHNAEMLAAYAAAAAEMTGEWGMAVGRVQKHYHADRIKGIEVGTFPAYVAAKLAHYTDLVG